jgi:hypothetical protein
MIQKCFLWRKIGSELTCKDTKTKCEKKVVLVKDTSGDKDSGVF